MSQVSFSLKTLAAACMMASCTHAFALEEITEKEMSEATGEGLAYFAEKFSLSMGDTDYIKLGYTSDKILPDDEKKAELYLYNFSIGKTNGTSDNRVVVGADIGSSSNPIVLSASQVTGAPVFDPDSTETSKIDVFSIALPERFKSDGSLTPESTEELKQAAWFDLLARKKNTIAFVDEGLDQDGTPNTKALSNRLRAQFVQDKFSLNGTKIKLWKSPTYLSSNISTGVRAFGPAPNTDPEGSTNGNNRQTTFTNGSTILNGTGVSSEYLLLDSQISGNGAELANEEVQLVKPGFGEQWRHNRYWYTADGNWGPVFLDYGTISRGADLNRRNRTHNKYRQIQIERYNQMYLKELARMEEAYSNKTSLSGVITINSAKDGVMRLSVNGTEPSLEADKLKQKPQVAVTTFGEVRYGDAVVAGAPNFTNKEGLYWKNFDNTLVLGAVGYQPVIIGTGGENNRELSLEVARIPNNPEAYNKAYINYDNKKKFTGYNASNEPTYGSRIGGLTEAQGMCLSSSCPETATHGSISFQFYGLNSKGESTADAVTNNGGQTFQGGYHGYGLGKNLANSGSAGINSNGTLDPLQSFTQVSSGIVDPINPNRNLTVAENGGTYNKLEGLFIQHLKLTTNAFD